MSTDFGEGDDGKPTCCETTMDIQKCLLGWTIHNFSDCRQGNNDALTSCIFSAEDAGSLKFRLDLYPRGTKEKADQIIIRLRLVTDRDDVRALARYQIGILNNLQYYFKTSGEVILTPGNYCQDIFGVNREEFFKKKEEVFPEDSALFVCGVSSVCKETTGTVTYTMSRL